MRVLSWNLKHGRAVPSAHRYLLDEFADALAGWPWDVALLQEVPPWWPGSLAERCGGEARTVLTSRNFALALRRTLATRWPDVVKSSGGGANAIIVRAGAIREHRRRRLCLLPERRWLQAVLVQNGPFGSGTWVGNLHATAHDTAAAWRDNRLAAASFQAWAGSAPCLLGGDFNLRELSLEGFTHAAGHDVDHVFARGPAAPRSVEVLERGHLSDHAPLLVTF